MRRLLLLASLLALAPLAVAQQETRFGLGIGLSNAALTTGDDMLIGTPASIFLPITFPGFRIEPELGFYRFAASNDDVDAEVSTSLFQLGTGLFALRPMDTSTLLYFGGRVGISRISEEESFGGNDESVSSTNFFIGPAIGGEYMFGRHFSLGGEAQLMFTSIGSPDEDDETSISVFSTGGVFFIRWHF